MSQALLNLCLNAIEAMGPEGRLEVTVEPIPHKRQLMIVVQDNGSGIAEEDAARIFDPYFTTKEKSEGTGLGLSVVHGIIQALKGSVTVETRPGDGARFHVYLPCNVGKDEPHIMQHNALPTGDERVLFLDDEDVLADMGKQMLEHLGYRVTVRTDSGEALKTFRSRPQDFDLIISDKTMPHMTGFLLTEKIKKIRPDIPVILCTGYCDDIEVERAAAVGVGRLVMKPLGMQELAEAVRCVLDSAETQA
jgi:CheY-like chemotaxis protein